jgi:hypothetical protein
MSKHPFQPAYTDKDTGQVLAFKRVPVNAYFYERNGTKHEAWIEREYLVTTDFGEADTKPVLRTCQLADLRVKFPKKSGFDWRLMRGIGKRAMPGKTLVDGKEVENSYFSPTSRKAYYEAIEPIPCKDQKIYYMQFEDDNDNPLTDEVKRDIEAALAAKEPNQKSERKLK